MMFLMVPMYLPLQHNKKKQNREVGTGFANSYSVIRNVSKDKYSKNVIRNTEYVYSSFFFDSLRFWHAAGRSPLSQIVDFGFLKS